MPTRRYAEGTTVSVESSQAEIIGLLVKYGVREHGTSTLEIGTSIWFRYGGILFNLEVANEPTDDAKESRRKWRSLVLVVKAKLVASADGITTIEREFLPFIMTDDGRTFADRFLPDLVEAAKVLNGRVGGNVLALPRGGK